MKGYIYLVIVEDVVDGDVMVETDAFAKAKDAKAYFAKVKKSLEATGGGILQDPWSWDSCENNHRQVSIRKLEIR